MINTVKNLVIRNIAVPIDSSDTDFDSAAIYAAKKAVKSAHIGYACDMNSFAVFKKSVDARKNNDIRFVYSVDGCVEMLVKKYVEDGKIFKNDL